MSRFPLLSGGQKTQKLGAARSRLAILPLLVFATGAFYVEGHLVLTFLVSCTPLPIMQCSTWEEERRGGVAREETRRRRRRTRQRGTTIVAMVVVAN